MVCKLFLLTDIFNERGHVYQSMCMNHVTFILTSNQGVNDKYDMFNVRHYINIAFYLLNAI